MIRYSLLLVLACSSPPAVQPSAPHDPSPARDPVAAPTRPAADQTPVAARRPHDVVSPHGTRNDPYFWLRDDTRKDKAMLAYLEAENTYAKSVLEPKRTVEDTLFAEMRGRIKEDDATVPSLDGGYWYYVRYETGKQYPIYARKKGKLDAAEEVLLDGNALAASHAFYRIGTYAVSRDGKQLAWAEDTVGRNQYALKIKNLATNTVYADTAANIAPSIAWASDNKTVFYTGKDSTTLREDRVFRHALGGAHDLVFREEDGSYYVRVDLSKSKRYVFIQLSSTTTSEYRLIDADKPAATPKVFLPRTRDHLHTVEHLGNRFVVLTNSDAKNFRLVEIAPGKQADRKAWKELLPHRPDALVERFGVYDTFVAANVRTGGLRKLQVLPLRAPSFYLDAADTTYAMSLIDEPDHTSKRVRYTYDAMQTPTSVFEVDITTKKRTLLKEQPVPTYDASKYASEYLHATAADGTKVPISVLYRKDIPRDGKAPLLISGYGSYGASQEPRFAATRVSLLDRGWVFAVAHIRGGQEMGRYWYEDGKLLKKVNTFTDFIAVTEHLVATKYAARDQVFAIGGSAGGLLMGAIANLRPDLYRGIIALVPFVDVVTTMLDETIPLTTNEFDEWGNPKDKAAYDYMLAYSPYDNIKPQAYPSIYVRTGLWDSQVQYFEPAKWVAKLRATKTDRNLVLFETDMTAGHGGAAGRFDNLRQLARAYAFLLHVRERPDQR